MPLNLQGDTNEELKQSNSFLTFKDISDLRVTLIGNKDLKFKLVRDIQFIKSIVKDFSSQITQIPVQYPNYLADKLFNQTLDSLEREGVILKILCSFITEVNTNKYSNITISLNLFEELLYPIVIFLSFFIDKFVPSIYANGIDSNIIKKVENIVGYCLDIFIGLSNNKRYGFLFGSQGSDKLWRFVTSLLIISDDESQIFSSLLIKSLRIVPLLLQNSKINDILTITLLSALLKRLSKECNIICSTHFPGIVESPEILNRIAFKDSNLPNIEPNSCILTTKINLPLLIDLITCTAQIFSFSKSNDYDIFMAPPSGIHSKDSSVVVLSVKIYISMLLLLKYENKALKLSSLNLIGFYLSNLRPSGDEKDEIFNNYKKIFPRIMELLDLDDNKPTNLDLPMYLLSPSKILANLCTQYPLLNDEIRRTNLDLKILKNLELKYKPTQQVNLFKSLKKSSQNGNKLVDFTVLLDVLQDDESISDLFLLLSVYTSSNEEHRHRITDSIDSKPTNAIALAQIIFEIIDNYRFLLIQIQLFYKILYPQGQLKKVPKKDLPWFSKNLGIIITLLDSPFYTNCLYLIRSLSRSVSTLRTFFVECNSLPSVIDSGDSEGSQPKNGIPGGFMNNVLHILKGIESSSKIIDFFYNFSSSSKNIKKSQMINKSITLGTLANFVLDFSSFRYEIVNDVEFLRNLSNIYQNSKILQYDNNLDKLTEEDIYQRNVIQLNVLQVLKNFMFNENNETKKEIIEMFPLALIFEKSSFGIEENKQPIEIKNLQLQQKLVAFDILRNFTAGSADFNEILVKTYEEDFSKHNNVPLTWIDYLIENITTFELFTDDSKIGNFDDDEFLLTLILNDNYVKLVTAINYIENHKYTNIENIKKEVFPNDKILSIWLKFLKLSVPAEFENKLDLNLKIALNNNLNEIKISIVWVLINLTWKNDTFGYQLPESNHFNLFDTIDGTSIRNPANDRVDLDDSDDSDAANNKAVNIATNSSDIIGDEKALTASDRARYLKDFGFAEVLTSLINYISKQSIKPSKTKELGGKRFDLENSNDLVEKIKIANHQISGLTRTNRNSIASNSNDHLTLRNSRALIAISRPDANRGGEGYGYGSDDDYANATDLNDHEMQNAEDVADDEEEDVDVQEHQEDYWIH